MEKLIIRRSEWATGKNSLALLDKYGKKCCLGFLALQKGYLKEQIYCKRTPASLVNHYDVLPGMEDFITKINLSYINSKNCETVLRINDDCEIQNMERELKLYEFFKIHFNIELEFVD